MVAWRFGFFMVALGVVMSWAVMLLFWTAVYNEGSQIGTYTLEQLLLYYTFNSIFIVVFDYSFVWDTGEALHAGRLSEYLTKPVSYLNFKFTQELGARTASLIAFALPLAAVVYYFRNVIPQNASIWLWCIATLIIGYVLTALFGIIISMMSIYFQNPHITNSVFFSISFLLAGRMIPISIMPPWLATIAEYSPFPLLTNVPLEYILGTRTALSSNELLFAAVWFVVLLVGARLMWKYAATKYEAGGI